MPKVSGGAQNIRKGDRVIIRLNTCYRHFLNGLVGTVTCVLNHGVIVALDNDPVRQQRVIAPVGQAGPSVPNLAQRVYQFNEVEKLT